MIRDLDIAMKTAKIFFLCSNIVVLFCFSKKTRFPSKINLFSFHRYSLLGSQFDTCLSHHLGLTSSVTALNWFLHSVLSTKQSHNCFQ